MVASGCALLGIFAIVAMTTTTECKMSASACTRSMLYHFYIETINELLLIVLVSAMMLMVG